MNFVLKGLNLAKIIKKSVILFWLLKLVIPASNYEKYKITNSAGQGLRHGENNE